MTNFKHLDEIFTTYPELSKNFVVAGEFQDNEFCQALYEYYEADMPIDMAQGFVGDSEEYIILKLQELGYMDDLP